MPETPTTKRASQPQRSKQLPHGLEHGAFVVDDDGLRCRRGRRPDERGRIGRGGSCVVGPGIGRRRPRSGCRRRAASRARPCGRAPQPCAAMIESPMPKPPPRERSEAAPRWNSSKICPARPAGMPGPVSQTSMRTCRRGAALRAVSARARCTARHWRADSAGSAAASRDPTDEHIGRAQRQHQRLAARDRAEIDDERVKEIAERHRLHDAGLIVPTSSLERSRMVRSSSSMVESA